MLIGYARVSTQDQNPQLQIDALRAVGCTDDQIYVEKASGAQRERPQLRAAIDYMRDGDTLVVWKLDTLVVWKLDRLARSLKQLIETVDGLEARGIGLRSLTDNIDTTTAGGRLIFHIFGALAEFERNIIRERTTAGLEAARARGRTGGRPRGLTDDQVAAARAMMRDPEITVARVAEHLGVGVSTLYRYLPGGRGAVDDRTMEPEC